jgi:hypothetical protein
MAKWRNESIGQSDIAEFCFSESDFAFELQTMALLRSLGVKCEHGGVYEDPVTEKARQFDIRGLLELGQINRVRLAVECKNIRSNFPFAVLTVPRSSDESYHEFISSHAPIQQEFNMPGIGAHKIEGVGEDKGKRIRQRAAASIYPVSEPVGKSCCQVGRDNNGGIRASDAEAYDKWWQAIQSSHDLVASAEDDWQLSRQRMSNTLVLPVIAVPDERLWIAKYNQDGAMTGSPTRANRASLYVNKFIPSSDRFSGIGLWISHIEVLTHAGLKGLVESLVDPSGGINPFSGY